MHIFLLLGAGTWEAQDKYSTPAPVPQVSLLQTCPGEVAAPASTFMMPNQNNAQSTQCRCEQLGRAPTQSEIQSFTSAGFTDVLSDNVKQYHPCPAGSVLIAHGAWWHRQVRNYSKSSAGEDTGIQSHHPNRRTALLANFTRSHVLPMKGETAMKDQYDKIERAAKAEKPEKAGKHLTLRERQLVKELWLGPSGNRSQLTRTQRRQA